MGRCHAQSGGGHAANPAAKQYAMAHTDHAVVIGARIGGLCAARALQRRFTRVTALETDTLPDRPQERFLAEFGWQPLQRR